MIYTGKGILDQINQDYIIGNFSIKDIKDALYKWIEDRRSETSTRIWYGINTVKYRKGKNLAQLIQHRKNAKSTAKCIKSFQGWEPKIEGVFSKKKKNR